MTYEGKKLSSGVRCVWKVKVWDETGAVSEWSEPATFSMGLLKPEDWTAEWIGLERDAPETLTDTDARPLPARMLRTEFEAPKVKRATAYICGQGSYELYLNGKKVGDAVLAPALSEFQKRSYYNTLDVTEYLNSGANALGVWLGNGRFFAPRALKPFTAFNFGYPCLLFQLHLELEDGTTQTVISNGSWKITTEGPIRVNNEFDGETYDARMEMPDWNTVGFDDSKWEPVQRVRPASPVLNSQNIEPIRVTERLKPLSINKLKENVYILDIGQNIVGWVQMKVKGTAGTSIKLRHAEALKPDCSGELFMDNIRGAKVTDIYTLKGEGVEVYEPRFTYHGFRFVEITGYPGVPTVDDFLGCEVHDDMKPTGSFTCSKDILNKIYSAIRWGVRDNYRSIPTDCPQRDERQGWMGDRAIESRGESYLFDVDNFYAKWMIDIEDAVLKDGMFPNVAPSYWEVYSNGVTWASAFIFIPYMLFEQYGNKRVLEERYPAMKAWIDRMIGFLEDGLTKQDDYGDWCVPPEAQNLIHSEDPARKTDAELISSAYLMETMQIMVKVANLFGKTEDAAYMQSKAELIANALNAKYLNRETGAYDNGSQTSSLLPLAFGIVPKELKGKAFARLIHKIEVESQGHIGVGLIGAQWLMRVLTDNGRADVAYEIATQTTYPGWGYMISKGATTIWELWNGDTANPDMNSHNHVMQIGDLNTWFHEYLGGMQATKPGFSEFRLKPHPADDLNEVKVNYHCPYGLIKSEWKQDGDMFEWEVTVPPNTTADICVPAKSADVVQESGKPASEAIGLKFEDMDNGYARFTAVSGVYRFVSKKKND
jgi:alpha-L-rhamnosidase